jgi:hypothetical protein
MSDQPIEIYTRPPAVQFATTGVAPPSPAYVTREDILRVQLWSTIPDVTVNLDVRLLLPNGIISPIHYDLVPSGDAATNTFDIDMAEGYLLSAVLTSASAPKGGAMYGRIVLFRGAAAAATHHMLLAAGYIVAAGGVSWPQPAFVQPGDGPGYVRVVLGTAPAAGAEISLTVGGARRWLVTSVTFTLTTSAVVANRAVNLTIDDGTTMVAMLDPPAVVPASTVARFTYATGLTRAARTDTSHQIPWPADLHLTGGWRIRTVTTGLQAGDQFSAPVVSVREWVQG